MDELKQWFRRVRCRLTGGHRYSDLGLVSRYVPTTNSVVFCNHCIKCGAFKIWDVDADKLFWGCEQKEGDEDGS